MAEPGVPPFALFVIFVVALAGITTEIAKDTKEGGKCPLRIVCSCSVMFELAGVSY
jgi:hypothetical protein